MSATTAKICGLSTPEAVSAAAAGGASHVGFMFFEKSPRHVRPELSAKLAEPMRAQSRSKMAPVKAVAVMVDPSDAEVAEVVRLLEPDLIQLHGKESAERTAYLRALAGVPIIKAIGVRDASDIAAALKYEDAADHLMFDAKAPEGADRPGGHGSSFDWTLLDGLSLKRPWFLAGGLDPWNVTDAMRLSRAPMVDVSSGVERGPGVKDPGLITAFLDAVRRA
ncbi:MAG: phosphoribosylanthranilate isomerase [Caulobacteraceae bacterium]